MGKIDINEVIKSLEGSFEKDCDIIFKNATTIENLKQREKFIETTTSSVGINIEDYEDYIKDIKTPFDYVVDYNEINKCEEMLMATEQHFIQYELDEAIGYLDEIIEKFKTYFEPLLEEIEPGVRFFYPATTMDILYSLELDKNIGLNKLAPIPLDRVYYMYAIMALGSKDYDMAQEIIIDGLSYDKYNPTLNLLDCKLSFERKDYDVAINKCNKYLEFAYSLPVVEELYETMASSFMFLKDKELASICKLKFKSYKNKKINADDIDKSLIANRITVAPSETLLKVVKSYYFDEDEDEISKQFLLDILDDFNIELKVDKNGIKEIGFRKFTELVSKNIKFSYDDDMKYINNLFNIFKNDKEKLGIQKAKYLANIIYNSLDKKSREEFLRENDVDLDLDNFDYTNDKKNDKVFNLSIDPQSKEFQDLQKEIKQDIKKELNLTEKRYVVSSIVESVLLGLYDSSIGADIQVGYLPNLYSKLADTYLAEGKIKESIEYCNKALHYNPIDKVATFILVMIDLKNKEYEKVLERLRFIINYAEHYEDRAIIFDYLSMTKYDLKEYEEAQVFVYLAKQEMDRDFEQLERLIFDKTLKLFNPKDTDFINKVLAKNKIDKNYKTTMHNILEKAAYKFYDANAIEYAIDLSDACVMLDSDSELKDLSDKWYSELNKS